MPRSGTKLLRELLNNHSKISVLTIETEFLPFWDKHWNTWFKSESNIDFDIFVNFFNKVITFPYFYSKSNQGKLIQPEDWYNLCDNFSLEGVFEALARHDASAGKDMIWGDKSPGYIRNIPLIKRHFPEAKIIHIIRDVRDYCLSINKAWGKNMLRAAERWSDDIARARKDGEKLQNDYFEVKYEDLLESPGKNLWHICFFLGIEYEPEMIELERPTENIGDARGKSGILLQNTNKYKKMMKPNLREKIEQIAFPELLRSGYECISYSQKKRLSAIEKKGYQVLDGFNLIRARKRQTGYGAIEALNFYLKSYKQSHIKR